MYLVYVLGIFSGVSISVAVINLKYLPMNCRSKFHNTVFRISMLKLKRDLLSTLAHYFLRIRSVLWAYRMKNQNYHLDI